MLTEADEHYMINMGPVQKKTLSKNVKHFILRSQEVLGI